MTTQTSAAMAAFSAWAAEQELTPAQYETLLSAFVRATSVATACNEGEPLLGLFLLNLSQVRTADRKFQKFVVGLTEQQQEVTRLLEARVVEIKEWEKM